jgi:hypothetical protein
MAPEIEKVEFGIRVEGPTSTMTMQGMVDEHRFVLDDPDDLVASVEGPSTVAALQLANLADLGPRPAAPEHVPVLLADALPSVDRAGLLETWSAEAREGTAIEDEHVTVWTAWAIWASSPRRAKYNTLVVADAGSRGIALVDIGEDGVIVRPTTSTELWRELTRLVPPVLGPAIDEVKRPSGIRRLIGAA